jgi:hypothetical protein
MELVQCRELLWLQRWCAGIYWRIERPQAISQTNGIAVRFDAVLTGLLRIEFPFVDLICGSVSRSPLPSERA